MSNGIILAALGGALAYGLTRKTKRKRRHRAAAEDRPLPDEVLDEGTGHSEVLGINVKWKISRRQGEIGWQWSAVDRREAEQASAPASDAERPFATEEAAYINLDAALGLHPMVKPPGAEGELWFPPPLFAVEVYPKGSSLSGLPPMLKANGFVVSDDCQVAGLGPMWWDSVGEHVEELVGNDVTSDEEIVDAIVAQWFPSVDVATCNGPKIIHHQLLGRVRDYLEETLGE